VRFKAISLEQAFTAIARTDALMDTLTALARGTLTLEQAQQKLSSFKVRKGTLYSQGHGICCFSLAAAGKQRWCCSCMVWIPGLPAQLSYSRNVVYRRAALCCAVQVDLPTMPPTKPVLVNKAATDSHPGMLVRLAGDRCAATTVLAPHINHRKFPFPSLKHMGLCSLRLPMLRAVSPVAATEPQPNGTHLAHFCL
jgi:hypothetical protein